MKEFCKKHLVLCLVLLFLPLIITMYVMNYVVNNNTEIVTFLSGIFTYYGTVILALVTIMQNDRLTALQERSAQIEETKIKEAYRPRFVIDTIVSPGNNGEYELETESIVSSEYEVTLQGHMPLSSNTFYLVLKNDSNTLAKNVKVYDYGIFPSGDGEKDFFGYKEGIREEIPCGGKIHLWYCFEEAVTQTFSFNMSYENIYGQLFYNKIFVMTSDFKGLKLFQCSIGEQQDGKAEFDLKTEYF